MQARSRWCELNAARQASAGLHAALPCVQPTLPSAAASVAARAVPLRLSTARGYAALPQPSFSEAAQQAASRLKSAAASVRAAPEALAKAPGTLYRALPAPAKRLVDAAQTPGAVNRVLSLQLEAFWQRHSTKVLALGGVVLCYALW